MVVRYEEYINNGEYFEAQKELDNPVNTETLNTDINVETEEVVKNNIVKSYLHNKFMIISILIISGIVIIFLFKKRYKR